METINFTRGVPANESFPTAELIDASTAVFKSHGNQMLQYGPSRGFEPLRQWLAEWQGVEVERVLTGNGSLQLIEFLCLHMIKPGDVVFTESPTYDRTITLLRRHGARVVGIQLEADGPNIDALESALKKRGAEVLLPDPRLPEPGGRDLLRREAPPARRVGEQARLPARRGRAVSLASLSRQGGADALRAGARAHAAHELVHQAHRARRAYAASCSATRDSSPSSPRWPRTRTSRRATSRRGSPTSGAAADCCRRRSSA